MNLHDLTEDLLSEKGENVPVDSATKPWGENADEKIKEVARKVRIILGEKFKGKIDNVDDLKKIVDLMKKNEDAFKVIFLWGDKSPKKEAEAIESIISKMSDEEIQRVIDGDDRQQFTKPKERRLYNFIETVEEKYFKKEVGDIGQLFYPGQKDTDLSPSNIKRRWKNLIPVKAVVKGRTYLGVVRPAGEAGGTGIITWQVNASNEFYSEREEGVSLPVSVPLMKKSEGAKTLGIHVTKSIQNSIDNNNLEFDDDPTTLSKMSEIVLNIMTKSGKKFRGKEIGDFSKDELSSALQNTDIPTWVFKDVLFWKEVGKFF